jgi:hypothetical protein
MQEISHFNKSNSSRNAFRNELSKFRPTSSSIHSDSSKRAKISVDPNPLRVVPFGNKYLDQSNSFDDVRNDGLGNLCVLEDEIILATLG